MTARFMLKPFPYPIYQNVFFSNEICLVLVYSVFRRLVIGDECGLPVFFVSSFFLSQTQHAFQRTGLAYAACNGHKDCVRLLLEAGADLEANDDVCDMI